jgi:hypothetical protein
MEYGTWPLYAQKRHALVETYFGAPLPPDEEAKAAAARPKGPRVCAKEVLEWMYAILTTLDSKSSALMRLNGVLIAAAAFLLGLFQRQGGTILSTSHADALVITTSAFLSAVSIGCCLFVVNVSWPFLGKMIKASDGRFDCTAEITALDEACTFRQRAYRSAWYISLVASAEFVLEFLWQTIHVIIEFG